MGKNFLNVRARKTIQKLTGTDWPKTMDDAPSFDGILASLRKVSDEQFLSIKNCGSSTLSEIKRFLSQNDATIRDSILPHLIVSMVTTMKNIPLRDFYFCPRCGFQQLISPPGPGEDQSNLDRACKCGHVWKVGTESELERALKLIQEATFLIGQAIQVIPPMGPATRNHINLRIIREQVNVAGAALQDWVENEYPRVKDKLPRP